MSKHFLRIGLAVWLGVIALAANVLEQQQLSRSLLVAVAATPADAPPGFHMMADGTLMAGVMHHRGAQADPHTDSPASGHTHQGHADCQLCGTVADMAAFALPLLPVQYIPRDLGQPTALHFHAFAFISAPRAPYASRAPPLLTV